MPVRMGAPRNIGGLSDVVRTPRYATGVGLLLYGLEQHKRDEVSRVNSGSFGDVMASMKTWFQRNFEYFGSGLVCILEKENNMFEPMDAQPQGAVIKWWGMVAAKRCRSHD
jgi:cell division ATPase FtsA